MSTPKVYNMLFQEERWGQKIHIEDIQVVQLADYEAIATRLAEVERERDDALERIENAQQSMSETQPSWERRCHSIMAALGIDYGGPTPDIPEQSGWYARNLKLAETALSSALAENERLKAAEAALKPFADAPDIEGEPDDKPLSGYWADCYNGESATPITFGHLRAAHALLTALQEQEEGRD